ncbi:MAG TPA: helix-turn-helix transcriptional regulator [Candidatus Paceibacterota bacterium]
MKDKYYTLLKFGRRIRTERLKLNISQERLGELAGVHRTYIGMIERGEKNITLLNMEKFASALNLELRQLIDF